MKVLHINTGQTGGAAWCAIRINNALVQQGIESRMLFSEGNSMPEGVEGTIAERDKELWYSNLILGKIKHLLMRMPWYYDEEKMRKILDRANKEKLYLHQPFSHYKNIAHHPLVEWADIIHLHWVPDMVDYPTFFKDVKKPIVWTLHDMLPAIGVAHYESEFTKLPIQLEKINKLCIGIKKKSVSKANNLHCVAISEMMKDVCKKSDILNAFPCSLIHNGVDTNIFNIHEVNKLDIINKYSYNHGEIDTKDTVLIMFSSYYIWDKRKGLDRVINAIESLETEKKIILLVVGSSNKNKKVESRIPIITTGLITNQTELAKLYSISDYFISASYEETYGQTTTEAMACGCPVISTPTGVAPDLIRPFNGVICNGYDSNDLADGITTALSTEYDSNKIRQHIIDEYDYSIIAKQYIELYTKILNE